MSPASKGFENVLQCKQLRNILILALGQQKKFVTSFALANGKVPGSSLVEGYPYLIQETSYQASIRGAKKKTETKGCIKGFYWSQVQNAEESQNNRIILLEEPSKIRNYVSGYESAMLHSTSFL